MISGSTHTHDVIFAADDGFAPHLGTAILSVLENNRAMNFRVHVITGGLAPANRGRLEEIAERYGAKLNVVTINDQIVKDLVITCSHFSKATYYRLLIPEVIDAERALYLDADLVVDGAIGQVLLTELLGKPLAAVHDAWPPEQQARSRLGMAADAGYFNSGVLLIDIALWRRERLHLEAIRFVAEHPEDISFADQCGLNAIVNGNWVRLHPRWNVQTMLLERSARDLRRLYSPAEVEEARRRPTVIHYSGGLKPWRYGSQHPFRRRYWHYRRMTSFSPYRPDGFTPLKALKQLVPLAVKRKLWERFGTAREE